MRKIIALSAASILALAGVGLTGSAGAQGNSHEAKFKAAVAEIGATEAMGSPADSQITGPEFERIRQSLDRVDSGRLQGAELINDPDYHLLYVASDPSFDCPGLYCEIEGAAFGIPKSDSANLYVVLVMDRTTDGSIPASELGSVGFFADTNRDNEADYGAITPSRFFGLGASYNSTLFRSVNGNFTQTAYQVTFSRGNDYWGIIIPWQRAGINSAGLVGFVSDEDDNFDAAPDRYTQTLRFLESVTGSPAPTPSPSPSPSPAPNPSPTPDPSVSTPGAITDITIRPARRGLRISWNPPDGSSRTEVTGYRYRIGNQSWKRTSNSQFQVRVKKNRQVTISVRAYNQQGDGPITRITTVGY